MMNEKTRRRHFGITGVSTGKGTRQNFKGVFLQRDLIKAQFVWYALKVRDTLAALVEIKHHGEKRVFAGGGRSVGPV